MAKRESLESLGLTEEVITEDMQEILRQTRSNPGLTVAIDAISPASSLRSGEIDLKMQSSEVYEIPALVENYELKPERFLLRRGRKARNAYLSLPSRTRDFSAVLSAAMKEVSLISNSLEPTNKWKFATSSDEISILPPYHGVHLIDAEFEKKGFTLWHPVDAKSIADKIILKKEDVNFMEFVNTFNPYILLHDLFAYKYEARLKKLLPEKNTKGYVHDFMTYLVDLYPDLRDNDQKMLKSNLESLVKTYFMPEEMRTVIHASHPYDNREVALVNPENMMFGPRVIDTGSVLGWPQIFGRISSETIKTAINGFYLEKRKKFYQKDAPNMVPKKLDPELFEYGTYFGGIYTALREARNFNTDVRITDDAVKKELQFLGERSKEAGFIYGILEKYTPKIIIPTEEKREDNR